MTHLAAVMTALEQIELSDLPRPVLEPEQALRRVQAVGMCGSDVVYCRCGRIGDYVMQGAYILGHETSGDVVEVGDAVDAVSVRDRVAIEAGTPRRTFTECMVWSYYMRPDLVLLPAPPSDGALVQNIALNARALFHLPHSLTYEEGALVKPLSAGLWGCQRAALWHGADVLDTGAGPVGLPTAEAARALVANTVTITDLSEPRLELAHPHGFAVERSDGPTSQRFDVLFESSGASRELAAGLVRLGEVGRAAIVEMVKQAITLALSQPNPCEIMISLLNRYLHTRPPAISLTSAGKIDLWGLDTRSFTLAETVHALLVSANGPTAVTSIICAQR